MPSFKFHIIGSPESLQQSLQENLTEKELILVRFSDLSDFNPSEIHSEDYVFQFKMDKSKQESMEIDQEFLSRLQLGKEKSLHICFSKSFSPQSDWFRRFFSIGYENHPFKDSIEPNNGVGLKQIILTGNHWNQEISRGLERWLIKPNSALIDWDFSVLNYPYQGASKTEQLLGINLESSIFSLNIMFQRLDVKWLRIMNMVPKSITEKIALQIILLHMENQIRKQG